MADEMTGFSKQEKHAIMRRLEQDGRWAEARDFKEEVRQSGQSNAVAWAAMIEKFPPPNLGDEEGETAADEKELDLRRQETELIARTKDQPINFQRDARWAYSHCSVWSVLPKDAPSFGAWGLLDFSRENYGDFLRVCSKYLFEESTNESKVADSHILKVIDKTRKEIETDELSRQSEE